MTEGIETCALREEELNLPDYLKRVETEIIELTEKADKLNRFTESEKFDELESTQQAFLRCQWFAMYSYLSILRQRFWYEVEKLRKENNK